MPLDAPDHTDRSPRHGAPPADRCPPVHCQASSFEVEIPDLASPRVRPARLPYIFWSDAATGEQWLGIGEADRIEPGPGLNAEDLPDIARERLGRIQAPLGIRDQLRYFGGIAFDPGAVPHPSWPGGGAGRFTLPWILLRRRRGEKLARGVRIEIEESSGNGRSESSLPAAGLRELLDQGSDIEESALSSLRVVESEGRRAKFEAAVACALRAIEEKELRKVVLSRDLILQSEEEIDPWLLVSRIAARAIHGVQFAFRFDEGGTFLGSTPERLFVQEGRFVTSDCLAGTAPRGVDPEKDRRLALGLLASEKDRREHRFVLDGIVGALAPLCRWIEAPSSPVVQSLPMVQHLHTPVTGWLRAGVALGEIIRSLHPTPAVGGAPRDAAIRWIRELEDRPRGWYTGAIGTIGLDRADFAVGIRSAILAQRQMTVFGGAGIVRGSDPALEWEETARKAASLVSLFVEEGCPTPI